MHHQRLQRDYNLRDVGSRHSQLLCLQNKSLVLCFVNVPLYRNFLSLQDGLLYKSENHRDRRKT